MLGRERPARLWHARGQGFKSPQLHQAQHIGSTAAQGRLSADCQQITSSERWNALSADPFGYFLVGSALRRAGAGTEGRALVPAIDYRVLGNRTRTGLLSCVAGGRSHSDDVVGSTVWSTTISKSVVKVSRSTWSRSRTLNASIVRAAS
jgi:hypothetical protein